MELVPVESSNIAAIGYSEECRLLRVEYRDGKVYDHVDVDPGVHRLLMGAVSKGEFMHAIAKERPGVRLQGGQTIKLREALRVSTSLQTYEPDKCCGSALSKAIHDGKLDTATEWVHEACGCTWHPRLVFGIRHWHPHEIIEVIR